MKEYTTDKIRNVCLAGQRGCGKTSLADAVAFNAGINNRVGRVDDGSSLLDYTDGEIARKTTLASKLLALEWNDTKINLFDCPGHSDFVGDFLSCVRVSDSVGFIIDGSAGVEVGTQVQWRSIGGSKIARFFLVNKFARENANWTNAIASIQSAFGNHAIPVQLPIGQADSFSGLVDLVNLKAHTFGADGKSTEGNIPADMKDRVEAAREALLEVAAESDDALLEKFFEEGTLNPDDMLKGLRGGIAAGKIFPIMVGSGGKNNGVGTLLDFVSSFMPCPSDMPAVEATKQRGGDVVKIPIDPSGAPIAFVFKSVSEGHLGDMTFFRTISGTVSGGQELYNQQSSNAERIAQVYSFQGKNRIETKSATAGDIGVLVKLKSTHIGDTLANKGFDTEIKPTVYPNPVTDVAIKPKTRGDEEKIASGLNRLSEEDPTFKLIPDQALKQQVLWGQGPTHIEVLLEKLKARYGVETDLTRPKIPYRETIKGKAEQHYKHKKQSGGRGQFGDVYIRLEPNARGEGFEFVDEISGGVIPGKFIPAVEKGIIESLQHGGLCGAQVVDVKVALYFGSYHDVDSSDMAFKIAGSMAFREGFLQAKPVILEPIYSLEILVPDDYTGDVMGDLSSRRGKIAGMDPEGRSQRIRATIPQAELYQYSVDLRSMTQGQGVYSMEFSHYEEVPHETSQKVIEEAKRAKEEES